MEKDYKEVTSTINVGLYLVWLTKLGADSSMSDDIYDKHAARVAVSIFRAVSRPELLPYMRRQLLKDITYNINNLTDQEIESHMGPLRELLANETKEDRPL